MVVNEYHRRCEILDDRIESFPRVDDSPVYDTLAYVMESDNIVRSV